MQIVEQGVVAWKLINLYLRAIQGITGLLK
jgi:hypothetical protein